MYEEKNTGSNLPAQIELYATNGNEYKFLLLTFFIIFFFKYIIYFYF